MVGSHIQPELEQSLTTYFKEKCVAITPNYHQNDKQIAQLQRNEYQLTMIASF
jgi:hypothetical protein